MGLIAPILILIFLFLLLIFLSSRSSAVDRKTPPIPHPPNSAPNQATESAPPVTRTARSTNQESAQEDKMGSSGVSPDAFQDKAQQILDRLMKDRIVFLGGPIDHECAAEVISNMKKLVESDASAPIKLYLNSPGGSVLAGLRVIQAMDELSAPIHTYAVGNVHSLATVILAHGEKKNRHGLPSSELTLTSLWVDGAPQEDKERMQAYSERIVGLLAADTGRGKDEIGRDMDGQRTLKGQEAIDYGLVDNLIH